MKVLRALGKGPVPFDSPVVRADDEGFLRGDACFDTALVTLGEDGATVELLDDHLERLAHSAARLGLPELDLDAWRELAVATAADWSASIAPHRRGVATPATGTDPDSTERLGAPRPTQGTLRMVWTRGPAGGQPLGFATVVPVSRSAVSARDGITVAALTNGQTTDTFADAPWLLADVKSAAYAQRMAALREAEARGAQDVLFVTVDGYAVDGSTSALVWLDGDTLVTPDPVRCGILRSRTVEAAFAAARKEGIECAEDMIPAGHLPMTEGAWLASSSRGIVPVLEIVTGEEKAAMRHDRAWTERLTRLAGF